MQTTHELCDDLKLCLLRIARSDFDVINVYDYAIEHMTDDLDQNVLREFVSEHRHNLQNLRFHMRDLNMYLPRAGSFQAALAKGGIMLCSLMGDEAVMGVVLFCEEHHHLDYQHVMEHPSASKALRSMLKKAVADECARAGWLRRRLD